MDELALLRIEHYEQELRSLVLEFPGVALLVGYAVFVLISLIPGSRGKALLFGWIFGFFPAILLVNLGLTTAALIEFGVSRSLFRDALYSRYGLQLDRLTKFLASGGARYLFTVRVFGIVPFTLLNYLAGATRLNLKGFWWTTQLGLLPGNVLFVYVGAHVPGIRELSEGGVWSSVSPELMIGCALLALIPLVVPRKLSLQTCSDPQSVLKSTSYWSK